MTVSFNNIPSNLRVPFVAAEIDSSRAQQGPALLAYRGLLIGQKRSTGTATANTLYKVSNANAVATLAGRGSMLHRQAIAWFANNRSTELWIGVLADDGSGVAASGTLAFTGPATAAGTFPLWCGDERVPVAIASGASAAAIATAVTAAINANGDLPITATADDDEVAIVFRHKGLVGNSYKLRHSYRDGEALPAGVGVTITQLASGTTNPALTTLLAAIGDSWFHVIAHPYTDATSLTAIEGFLATAFGPTKMTDGVAFTSALGSFASLSSLGSGRNSQHSVILSQPGENPLTPPMEHAAEVAAVAAVYGAEDPARPFQTLPLARTLPPIEADRFTLEERNLLLFDGIATTKVGPGEVVQIERLITTYQTNATGADDTSYLDITSLLTLMYLRYSFRVRMATKYPRHKLASDGTRFGPGQAVITPKDGKGEAVGWFKQMEFKGLVEGLDQFKRDLVVERNGSDPNRLDFLLPPDLINQLMVTAASIQFRL